MKPAAKHLFLSVFALWRAPACCEAQDRDCPISPKAIVSDACASYSTLERLNTKINPVINELTHGTDFFSHYRVNLFYKRCPFWDDEDGMCGNIGCAVQTLENEEDIPEVWRAHELGKLEGPSAKHPAKKVQIEKPQRPLGGDLGEDVGESCVVEYDDECDELDYCVPEDESATSKGDYVSLIANPERFTGYSGDGAKQVWDAIYRENCFQKSSFSSSSDVSSFYSPAKNPAALDFKSVLDAAGRQQVLLNQRQTNPSTPFVAQTGFEVEDECLEKRVFYRVISGMHTSITSHLCWNFLNQTTGEWTPNLNCYRYRLSKFPDRISNLYFNYALLTRAIAKLDRQIEKGEYVFCTGDKDQDSDTRGKVVAVISTAASVPQLFDESLLFTNGEGPSLKEDFRNRFRNVSRLMDCVGCDKCRLWGKLQTAGYGTALKVLFETDNKSQIPHLKRTELVALFNTYARLSNSLKSIMKFRVMLEEEDARIVIEETVKDATENEPEKSEENQEIKSKDIEPEKKQEKENTSWEIPDRAKKSQNVMIGKKDAPSASLSANGQQETFAPPTFSEIVKDEFETFTRVTKYVLSSWIEVPVNLYRIFISELVRGWQYYAGREVDPKIWSWKKGWHVSDEL